MRIFPVIFLFFLPLMLAAQQSDTISRLQFGIGFGVMDHEVEFTPIRNVVALRGSSYTLNLRYFDTNLVGFQAELGYSQAGWEQELEDSLAANYVRSADFVELLILTQFSIGKGFFQPMLQAGPYLSVPIGSEEAIPPEYVDPDGSLPDVIGTDLPGRLNYGAQIGVGFNVEIGPLTIQAEGRYLVGFSDLFKNGTTSAATSRRQGIGAKLGLFSAF